MSRIRLVTLDVDGTLLPKDNCFAAIMRGEGRETEAQQILASWQSGELQFSGAWNQLWALMQPLDCQTLHRHLRKVAKWLPDISLGVREMRNAGLHAHVLSDLPSTITDFLGRWGLIDSVASPVVVREGAQISVTPKLDRLEGLEHLLQRYQIDESQVAHVGNGILDVPIWDRVGLTVGVDCPPAIATDFRQEADSLLAVAKSIVARQN